MNRTQKTYQCLPERGQLRWGPSGVAESRQKFLSRLLLRI